MVPSYGQGVPALHMASNTRRSWHNVATAATFIPMSYNLLANFNLSQFMSRTVPPELTPSTCVCTAPEVPVVQRSLLPPLIIAGAIAVGGG